MEKQKTAIEKEIPTFTLEGIEMNCWKWLSEGSLRGRDGFHTFTLANIFQGQPEVRTVVLRKVERFNRCLYAHTDKRSPKARQMGNGDQVALLFYDALRKVQIRIKARVSLLSEGRAFEEAWANTRLSSRKCYLTEKAPGTRLGIGGDSLSPHLRGKDPEWAESEAGLANFLLMRFEVQELDWLFLHNLGHRRAVIAYNLDGYEASWINP